MNHFEKDKRRKPAFQQEELINKKSNSYTSYLSEEEELALKVQEELQGQETLSQQYHNSKSDPPPSIIKKGSETDLLLEEIETLQEKEGSETATINTSSPEEKPSDDGKDKEKYAHLAPKPFADNYFTSSENYSWTELKKLFRSDGSPKENEKIKQYLLDHCPSWNYLRRELEENHGIELIHTLVVGDVVLIEAPTVGLAFYALEEPAFKLNYIRDISSVFFYTDGKQKPYPVTFDFKYTPSDEQLQQAYDDIVSKREQFDGLDFPKITYSNPNKKPLTDDEKRGAFYAEVTKNYKKEIEALAEKYWRNPNENSSAEIADLGRKYMKEFNVEKTDILETAKFPIYHATVQLLKHKTLKGIIKKPGDITDGSFNAYEKLREQKLNDNKDYLAEKYEEVWGKYQEKHHDDIISFVAPFMEMYQQKEKKALENKRNRLLFVKTDQEAGEIEEAFKMQLEFLREHIYDIALIELQQSPLWEGLTELVEKDMKPFYDHALEDDFFDLIRELDAAKIDAGIEHPNFDLYEEAKSMNADMMSSRTKPAGNEYESPKLAEYPTIKSKEEAYKNNFKERILPILKKEGHSQEVIDKLYKEYLYKYSQAFLYNTDGSISQYGFIKWAEEMSQTIKLYREATIKEKIILFDLKANHIIEGTKFNVYRDMMTELSFQIEQAEKYLKDILEYPQKSEGHYKDFIKGFNSLETEEAIPFIRNIFSTTENYNLNKAATYSRQGLPLSPTEKLMLESYGTLNKLKGQLKSPIGYQIGEQVAHGLVSLSEFAITAPIGGLGISVVRKTVTKTILKSIKKQITRRIVVRGLEKMAGAAFITLANPQRLIEDLAQRRNGRGAGNH